MKQLQHIFSNTKALFAFIQDSQLKGKVSAQVYAQNEAISEAISASITQWIPHVSINAYLSSEFSENQIDFTQLPESTHCPSVHDALYGGIINTTTEGFWLLDKDLRITDVNDSLCTMLGYEKEEMLSRTPLDFIDSRDHNLCHVQAHRIENVSNRIYEIRFRCKSGELMHTLTNATTIYEQDKHLKTFAFMTDISRQKAIEEDLRRHQDQIYELNNSLEHRIAQEVEKNRQKEQMMYQQARLASMGEMIGNIAHQWRQPLNIMALVMQDIYISSQLGTLTPDKIEASYEKSNNLLQYMSQTIDDFRNFFRQHDKELTFSVQEALDSVYSLVATNLSYHHIECDIKIGDDSIVQGGLNEFRQVLINIINNAQEAIGSNTQANRQISIETEREGQSAIIRIRDDGGGIDKEVIDKIFDPYFTTKNKTQGTGLGLYMSKQIIEHSMGGSLCARNVQDGAEFIIRVPLKLEALQEAEQRSTAYCSS